MTDWQEIADRVYVLRYPVLDVNTTLIVGDGAALVVDTLATPSQARTLTEAVRRITPHPWSVVNTHHHFDHAYGNQAFGDCAIWGHEETAQQLSDVTPRFLGALHDEWEPSEPDLAAELLDVTVVPPNRVLKDAATVDVGGRPVQLRYFGRGHTAGDLVVHVPRTCLLAGDLVEEGAPPGFDDSYPLEWPHTVAELLHLADGPVVPGHGAVVDHAFVKAQHDDLSRLAWLIRDGHADDAPPAEVARQAPFDPQAALVAVRRGYAELSGRA